MWRFRMFGLRRKPVRKGATCGQKWTEAPLGSPNSSTMDARPLFQTLLTLAEDNVAFFQNVPTETGQRFLAAFTTIREHARCLEPMLDHFSAIYHIFDLDEHTPANGYRSLAQTVRCCVAHIIHKSRYVATNRRSIFFRTNHNCSELEAYCVALTQLRALVYLAQHLLTQNRPGYLFNHEDRGLSEQFLREYVTMQKGCFYGRCMGFQFAPSIRPFLQTIAISLVSFGENYKRNTSGIGVAAGSLFMSGKFAIDPELRGSEFERITQNLDVHFWKRFWNLTETELLASLASMASSQVRLSRALLVPPHSFDLPLVSNPKLTVTITPPVAHTGPGAVQMRLISHELREGQDSEELLKLMRPEGTLALELPWKSKTLPRSPYLMVHFHGGGFVAQTSKSHEPYLKSWAQELGAPILSIDYSLSPEAPFPRALEECFFAYCWALKNCHLLGSTAQTVCLAGDSAGGNLCITVSMRAAAFGIKMPDGIMAAYPVTLLEAAASPSRLLTLLDPLLPLSVLCKCLSAYAGMESEQPDDSTLEKLDPMNMMRHNTALLFRDLRLGASALVGSLMDKTGKHNRAGAGNEALRKSASETSLKSKSFASHKDSRKKSQTCQNFLGSDLQRDSSPTIPDPDDQPTFFFSDRDQEAFSSSKLQGLIFPDGFQPLRSNQPATSLPLEQSPIVKNPFMSPLLAPDEMLKGLPPIHIVACALDPMLDDSVMFAQRLRALGQPVTLRVVQDLPHGFLSLSQLCRETRQASAVCTELIRNILVPSDAAPPPPPAALPKHRKLERTSPAVAANADLPPIQENGVLPQHKASHNPTEETRTAKPNEEAQTTSKTPEPQTEGRSLDQQNKAKNISTPPTAGPILNAAIIPAQDSGTSSSTSGRGVGA
ncbi:hormone-sensitive lipase isoform X3 [Ahaetulla prasina]|uniref:hormone-sensitive lipase isoform X3 n=1 Tax=Ahaetulla prasina TaxID=499056 RepID=UPI00264A4C20|nr:hormone-sensitive lipase isoform X3 [Ahaetulla prasina]